MNAPEIVFTVEEPLRSDFICKERSRNHTVEYIRADIAAQQIAAMKEQRNELLEKVKGMHGYSPKTKEDDCDLCNLIAAIESETASPDAEKDEVCSECGAKDSKEAESKCKCSGDRDWCHGCSLWPDD